MEMTKQTNLFEPRSRKAVCTQNDRSGTNEGGGNEKNLIMNLGDGTYNESDDGESWIMHETGMSTTKNGVTY
jgi:hypothetical protein